MESKKQVVQVESTEQIVQIQSEKQIVQIQSEKQIVQMESQEQVVQMESEEQVQMESEEQVQMESEVEYDIFSVYGDKIDIITENLNKKTLSELDSTFPDVVLEHILNCLTSKKCRLPSFGRDFQWINTARSLSSEDDLQNKVYVLDFFTYCCINCIHILPLLKEVETKYTDNPGFAVIGVHSPKFINEKDMEHVKEAVTRNSIKHPVLNDPSCTLWKKFGVYCWPTVFIVGPDNILLFVLVGELQIAKLSILCDYIFKYLESHSLELCSRPLPIYELQGPKVEGDTYLFPGGISTNDEEIIVTDTGHNRLFLYTGDNIIKEVIGSGAMGSDDGPFDVASFNSPHGTTWHNGCVYVADTGNHSIRKIDLKEKTVSTVFNKREVSGLSSLDASCPDYATFNSPWDVCVGLELGVKRMKKKVLYIAVAGSHQIWSLDFESSPENPYFCIPFAGSGKEENRPNMFRFKAGFAQPSGITFSDIDKEKLFIADSESSTIKCISLLDGAVKTIVGGGIDPTDLFQFGDEDGHYREVKLQHPMSVCVLDKLTLLIADTYNHKIKLINLLNRGCKTLETNFKLNEPNSMCLFQDRLLLIADTNNHCVMRIPINVLIPSIEIVPETFDSTLCVSNISMWKEDITLLPLSKNGRIYCFFEISPNFPYSLDESAQQRLNPVVGEGLEDVHRSKSIVFGEHQPTLIIKSVPDSKRCSRSPTYKWPHDSENECRISLPTSKVTLTVILPMCDKRDKTYHEKIFYFKFRVLHIDHDFKDFSRKSIRLSLQLTNDIIM